MKQGLEKLEAGVGNCTDCVIEEASEEDETGSVDIMGSKEIEAGSESERFTFANILQRQELFSETLLPGVVDTS